MTVEVRVSFSFSTVSVNSMSVGSSQVSTICILSAAIQDSPVMSSLSTTSSWLTRKCSWASPLARSILPWAGSASPHRRRYVVEPFQAP